LGKRMIRLLLAFSLLAAVVQPAAVHGEELTPEEKFNRLVEQGIFDGFPDGQSHLDWNMSRAQAAKIIVLILGLEPNDSDAGSYLDLAEAEWAAGYISVATSAGILEGYGNGIFDPTSDVTVEQLAKIMVEALDLEVDDDATVEGASDWAGKYVKAALDAGLIPPQSDYTKPASRELLVIASYAAHEQLQENAEETAWIISAKQTGARKVELTFKGTLDPDTATIIVERIEMGGGQRMAVGIERLEWSADEGAVTVVLDEKIETGRYEAILTVQGDEKTVTSQMQFNTTAESLERIELGGADTLPKADGVEVPIHLYNQFGEEMDERPDGLLVSGSIDTRLHPERNVVLLNLSRLAVGSSVTVAVLTDDRFANRTYTVGGEPELKSVETAGFVDASGAPVSSLKKGETAYLLLRPLDQFGNLITDLDWLNGNLRAEAVIHDLPLLQLPKTLVAGPGGTPAVSVTGGAYLRDTVISVTVYSNLGEVLAQASITVPFDLSNLIPAIVPPARTVTVNLPGLSADSVVTVTDAVYSDITTYVTVTSTFVTDVYYKLVPAGDPAPDKNELLGYSGTGSDWGQVKTNGKVKLAIRHNSRDIQYKLYFMGASAGGSLTTDIKSVDVDTDTEKLFNLIQFKDVSTVTDFLFRVDYTPAGEPVKVYFLLTDLPLPDNPSPDEIVNYVLDPSQRPVSVEAVGLLTWSSGSSPIYAGPNDSQSHCVYVVVEYKEARLKIDGNL